MTQEKWIVMKNRTTIMGITNRAAYDPAGGGGEPSR